MTPDGHRDRRFSKRVRGGLFNLLWLVVTIMGLATIDVFWPHETWGWGLLLGAGVGASAIIVVALFARRVGDRRQA